MSTKPKLLITGVNGYLGSWCAKKAIENGNYDVIGTVRNKDDTKKIDPLKAGLGELYEKLTLRNADLTKKDTLKEAVKGVDYILHVASPFPDTSPKDEDLLIKPAVEGTLGILEAAAEVGVKRVVLTSSVAAIHQHGKEDAKADETSWPDNTDELPAYYKSKILAEKAAWAFVEDLPEEKKFELVVLNPGFIIGPMLFKAEGTSIKMMSEIMTGAMWSIPQIYFSVVDVRDVAEAHIKAITMGKDGNRYAIVESTQYLPELGKLFAAEYGQYGYKSTTGEMCKFTAWMASFFLADAELMLLDWNMKCEISNNKAKDELKIDFIATKKSVIDMGDKMIELEIVPDLTEGKRKGKQEGKEENKDGS